MHTPQTLLPHSHLRRRCRLDHQLVQRLQVKQTVISLRMFRLALKSPAGWPASRGQLKATAYLHLKKGSSGCGRPG